METVDWHKRISAVFVTRRVEAIRSLGSYLIVHWVIYIAAITHICQIESFSHTVSGIVLVAAYHVERMTAVYVAVRTLRSKQALVHSYHSAVVGKDYGITVLASVEEAVSIVLLPSACNVAGTIIVRSSRSCAHLSGRGRCSGTETVGGIGILEQGNGRKVEPTIHIVFTLYLDRELSRSIGFGCCFYLNPTGASLFVVVVTGCVAIAS